MEASGRPTVQGRPRFVDLLPRQCGRPDINPYLRLHREFGPPLLPASEAGQYRGQWARLFGAERPLHVEIGAGNGHHLAELARRHPEWNVLGIELRFKRTVLTAKKIRAAGLSNAWILRYHAAYLHDLFERASIAGLYVHHPDPWPKERHEQNRLVSRWFLEDVSAFLAPNARLQMKSDYPPNIDRLVELMCGLPLEMTGRSSDIAASGTPWVDDIPTQYQRKMLARGVPVHAIEVVRV